MSLFIKQAFILLQIGLLKERSWMKSRPTFPGNYTTAPRVVRFHSLQSENLECRTLLNQLPSNRIGSSVSYLFCVLFFHNVPDPKRKGRGYRV